eukprot:516715-Rhodomonas_salina.1
MVNKTREAALSKLHHMFFAVGKVPAPYSIRSKSRIRMLDGNGMGRKCVNVLLRTADAQRN